MNPKWALKIKEEIWKQLDAIFIKVVHFPQWLANVVSIPKKGRREKMFADFRDPNNASPQDDFSQTHRCFGR